MKRDEPFNPSIQGGSQPDGLIFRMANRKDSQSINILMHERNPSQSLDEIEANTHREIDRVESDSGYKLYVAELNNEVVGLCRFFHSKGLPGNKKIYPAPEGWYGMGILVSSKFRRLHIASFLSYKRIEVLKTLGAKEFYSFVDSNNLTSMRMHQSFGFVEIARAKGFMQVSFNSGLGCLFRLEI